MIRTFFNSKVTNGNAHMNSKNAGSTWGHCACGCGAECPSTMWVQVPFQANGVYVSDAHIESFIGSERIGNKESKSLSVRVAFTDDLSREARQRLVAMKTRPFSWNGSDFVSGLCVNRSAITKVVGGLVSDFGLENLTFRVEFSKGGNVVRRIACKGKDFQSLLLEVK